jgi:hypothetical protein
MFDKCLFLRRLFLVSGMLAFNVSAYGEVLIINTQTLDPATLTVQPSTSNVGTKGRSAQAGSGKKREAAPVRSDASFIDSTKALLLERYGYQEKSAAVASRSRLIQDLALKIDEIGRSSASEKMVSELKGIMNQLNTEIGRSSADLSKFELTEFQQLYRAEQQNASQLKQLQAKLNKVPVVSE